MLMIRSAKHIHINQRRYCDSSNHWEARVIIRGYGKSPLYWTDIAK
jgi:hypothetical protein